MVSFRAGIPLALVATAIAALLLCAGCKRSLDLPKTTFEVVLKVESDPRRPLAGVPIVFQNRELASTGADGRTTVTVEGRDGEIVELFVRCPSANVQPAPVAIALRRYEGSKISQYDVACPPLVRRAIVGIRAENGPNLPVVVLGTVVARTDASGAAHFALDVRPGESFDVQIDTSSRPKTVPLSPSRTFTMPDHDDILVFSQTFGGVKKRRVEVRRGNGNSGPRHM